ncbi:MAG: hypothetical protein IPH53_22780 [Flavobacteriales bacterium]|nr:hypothetical protein [Flavobacteriales bacterium]
MRKFKNPNSLELRNNKLKELPEWIGELNFYRDRPRTQQARSIPRGSMQAEAPEEARGQPKRDPFVARVHRWAGEVGSAASLSNDIGALPLEAENLKALRLLDRAIQMNEEEQAAIRELVPGATMYFSNPCNCGF